MKFGGIIRGWYKKNKRDLPWRRIHDPYRVWISEVILQQTRISQGLEYYNRFVGAFPDVESLARAEADDVLKLWQGLGYYSRARNLHQAAKAVVEEWAGVFPGTYKELLKLKGVGNYTASAIASICFGERSAVVDGNVARVIARLYGVEEAINSGAGNRIVSALADELIKEGAPDPGTHNQAMMEFGALQCVPVSPRCGACPLENHCQARLSGRVDLLPKKRPGKKPVDRYLYYYIILYKGEAILTRREENDIWKSLYQFPLLEAGSPVGEEELAGKMLFQLINHGASVRVEKISETIRHQLTHRNIHARFIHVRPDSLPHPLPANWMRVPLHELEKYPVPRLIHRYMESAKFSYL